MDGRRRKIRKIRTNRKTSWKKAVIPGLAGITILSLMFSYVQYNAWKLCLQEKGALEEQLQTFIKQEEEVENGREVFLPDIALKDYVQTNDRIDIRIRYDNAEDYTVLLDKKVKKCDAEYGIVLELTEEEIWMISSAIADKKQYEGTSLYAAKYPDNSNDTDGRINYIPNRNILILLGREKTEGESRIALEERLMRSR